VLAGLTDLPDETLGTMLDALFARMAADQPTVIDEAEWVKRVDSNDVFAPSPKERRRLMKASRAVNALCLHVARTWMGVHTTLVCNAEEQSFAAETLNVTYALPDDDVAALLSEVDPGNAIDLLSTARRGYAQSASETWVFHGGLTAIGASLRGDTEGVVKILRWPAMTIQQEGPKGPKASVRADFRWGRLDIVLPPAPPPSEAGKADDGAIRLAGRKLRIRRRRK
jgi:hypothetical protein